MLLNIRTSPPIIETCITGVDSAEGLDNTQVGSEVDRLLDDLGITWKTSVIHDGLMVRSETEDPRALTDQIRTALSSSEILAGLDIAIETI